MKYVFGHQHTKHFIYFNKPYFTHEQTICGVGPFYSLDQILLCLQNRPNLANRIKKARNGTFVQICNRLSNGSPPYGIKVLGDEQVEELIRLNSQLEQLNIELKNTGLPKRIYDINKLIQKEEDKIFGSRK